MAQNNLDDLGYTLEAIPELDRERLVTYARLWQLETWLRYMVYVELQAKYGTDWHNHVQGNEGSSKKNDKDLTHMPSPEETKLSFISFSLLCKTIENEWAQFGPYLPPQTIWKAKIEEVSQVRNRIAHFRRGHKDDLQRVLQLLRDLDAGFYHFCTSINSSLFSLSQDTNDPIIQSSASLNPYVKRGPEVHHLADRLEIKLEIVPRPWSAMPNDYKDVVGKPGFFYDLNIHAYSNRIFHYENFLRSTKRLHDHVLFIILTTDSDHIRILLPSLLGVATLINLVDTFIQAAANELWPARSEHSLSEEDIDKAIQQVQNLANRWPEYVLGPRNPISFLTSDMPCSFFDAH